MVPTGSDGAVVTTQRSLAFGVGPIGFEVAFDMAVEVGHAAGAASGFDAFEHFQGPGFFVDLFGEPPGESGKVLVVTPISKGAVTVSGAKFLIDLAVQFGKDRCRNLGVGHVSTKAHIRSYARGR